MDTNEKAIEMHKKWNGKLETISKTPVKTREDYLTHTHLVLRHLAVSSQKIKKKLILIP